MVTPETREQLQRVNDNAGMLPLLVLSHPSIATAYIVSDTRNWVIGGVTYVGLPFRFKLPNAVANQSFRAQLQVDNIGRGLSDAMEQLPPGAALQAAFSFVSRARPTVVDYSFQAPLSNVSVTVPSMTAVLGNDDAGRAPAVKLRYDQTNSPGLFPG